MSDVMTTAEKLQRSFAPNVRRIRREQGLTVQAAAAAAKMHWRHWQKIEAEDSSATIKTICRIAAGLCVSPAELFRPLRGRR